MWRKIFQTIFADANKTAQQQAGGDTIKTVRLTVAEHLNDVLAALPSLNKPIKKSTLTTQAHMISKTNSAHFHA